MYHHQVPLVMRMFIVIGVILEARRRQSHGDKAAV